MTQRAKLSILFISNYYVPHFRGGYANRCRKTADGLSRRGHNVRVLTSHTDKSTQGTGDWDRQESGVGVRRTLVPIDRRDPLGLLQKSIHNHRETKACIDSVSPDLIIVFGIDGVGFNVYQTVLEAGRPTITSLGDTWLSQACEDLSLFDAWASVCRGTEHRIVHRSAKRLIGFCGSACGVSVPEHPFAQTRTNFISEYLLNELERVGGTGGQSPWIIPLPLDEIYLDEHRSLKGRGESFNCSETLRLLFLSRMEWLKGPDVALKAVAKAISLGANVRLTVSGLNLESLQPELAQMAKSLGIDRHVDWVKEPSHHGVIDLYRRHDLFLFPSRIVEGMGNVNAEAMACGLPVLGVTKYGSKQIIKDGYNGLSHEPGDYESLGSQLAHLAMDRDLLYRLSENALKSAEAHHPDLVLDDWERGIFVLLGSKQGEAQAMTSAGTRSL